MSFDLNTLRSALDAYGTVARVVIADFAGSSPREVGAAMLVWDTGQSGTIGGGALEYDAARAARAQLAGATPCRLTHHALGPDLGQCCGGRVSLVTELYDQKQLSDLSTEVIARPVAVDNLEPPLSVTRILSTARAQGDLPAPRLIDGWMIEPVSRPSRPVWIWGAGHVGRALVHTLAPLPGLDITWIDTDHSRFPDPIPARVSAIPQSNPGDLARHAPDTTAHLILTYSHALDLDLCHRLLQRPFAFAGLIGSKTKWARFRKRLSELGHTPDQIARITCPIGDPTLGKHPHEIAIGVAHDLMMRHHTASHRAEKQA